jgi:hypothetical protein
MGIHATGRSVTSWFVNATCSPDVTAVVVDRERLSYDG